MNKNANLFFFIIIIILFILVIYVYLNILFSTSEYNNKIPFDEPLNDPPDDIAENLATVLGTGIENQSSLKRKPGESLRFGDTNQIEHIYNCSNNGSIYILIAEDSSQINVRYSSRIGYLNHTKTISFSEEELKDKALKFFHNFGIIIDSNCIFEITLNNDKSSGHLLITQTFRNKKITNYDSVFSFIRFDYDKEFDLIQDLEINNWYIFPRNIRFDKSEDEAYQIGSEYLRNEKKNPYWDEKKIEYYSVIDNKLCYVVSLYHYEEQYYASGDYYYMHVDVQSGKILNYRHSMLA